MCFILFFALFYNTTKLKYDILFLQGLTSSSLLFKIPSVIGVNILKCTQHAFTWCTSVNSHSRDVTDNDKTNKDNVQMDHHTSICAAGTDVMKSQ